MAEVPRQLPSSQPPHTNVRWPTDPPCTCKMEWTEAKPVWHVTMKKDPLCPSHYDPFFTRYCIGEREKRRDLRLRGRWPYNGQIR